MAGYNGYSMSNNAIAAEKEGKYPASILAKKLKAKTAAVKELMLSSEWHHTSSYYNVTDYYDGELLLKVFNNEDLSDYDDEDVNKAKELLIKLKEYKAKTSINEYTADIEYIEWSGSRNYPKANVKKFENVKVVEKGSYYYFDIDGNIIK